MFLRKVFNFINNTCMYMFFWTFKTYTYLVCATMTCVWLILVRLSFFFMEFYVFHWIFSTASIIEHRYLLITIIWNVLIPWGFFFVIYINIYFHSSVSGPETKHLVLSRSQKGYLHNNQTLRGGSPIFVDVFKLS